MTHNYIFQAGVIVLLWAQLGIYALTLSNLKVATRIIVWGTITAAIALLGQHFYPLESLL